MVTWLVVVIALPQPINAQNRQRITAPPALRDSDRVAIIAPASRHPASVVDSGASAMRRWGYVPVIGKNVYKSNHGFAGTIQQRKEDLLQALQDTTIKAILCTRGGYGSPQLLSEIPLEVFAANPKWIIGYSDITALLSANVCAGTMGIHGNMANALWRNDSVTRTMQHILRGHRPTYHIEPHKFNVWGSARGIVVGGNLSVITDLAETRFDFLNRNFLKNHDVILFIEDTHENFNHVDRMLYQLKLRGVLDKVKGIMVGIFNDYSPENGYTDMYQMINRCFKDLGIPVCYNFPTGHRSRSNYPMIEGCPATLVVDESGATLQYK